jgi:predicted nucleotidyltransferase component of viral defense system
MDFTPMLARELKIQDQALLEQDIRLHHLLHRITYAPRIGPEVIFKGGTCVIKCHLDYPRFSVDLDFTWRDQEDWITATTKAIRERTRSARRLWRDLLTTAAHELGYGFDQEQILWGSSSRMATANFRYVNLHGEPATVKIQMNFVEPMSFAPTTRTAKTLISGKEPKATRILDDDILQRYRTDYEMTCYDAGEIAAEKCRAILTRRAPKGRDILDLYLLERDLGVTAEDLADEVQSKLDFALGLGEKYLLNLAAAPDRFSALAEQDIRPLLLKEIDLADYDRYRVRLLDYLAQWMD